jgi:hypothetical protein
MEPEPEPEPGGLPEGVPGAGVPMDAANARRVEESRGLARMLVEQAAKVCQVEERRTGGEHSSGTVRTIMKDMEGVVQNRQKELMVR